MMIEEEIRRRIGNRDTDVLVDRFYRGRTLEELGTEQGCTRQRIHAIQQRALRRLAADPIVKAAARFTD